MMRTSFDKRTVLAKTKKLGLLVGLTLCSSLFLASESFSKSPSIESSLRPFNAQFTAYRSGNDIGNATLSLENLENSKFQLNYASKVSRFFISDKRYETSIFNLQDDQLIPLSYDYKRTGTGPNKKLSLDFSPENQSILVDDEKSIDWQGEFDNQLFRIDLPRKLANGETSVVYDFYNYRGEKRQYIMELVATDNLKLPYGQLTAYKVKINRKSNSRVTFAWFAPSLDHNLVRLQQFKDGEEQGDIQLRDFAYQ